MRSFGGHTGRVNTAGARWHDKVVVFAIYVRSFGVTQEGRGVTLLGHGEVIGFAACGAEPQQGGRVPETAVHHPETTMVVP